MAKIKFIRRYKMYGHTYYDVIYQSNRIYTFTEDDVPKTARRYMETANAIRDQIDRLFNRPETIYEHKEGVKNV